MHCGETYVLPAQAQRVVLGLQWEECHADTDLDIDVSCALLTPLGRVVDTVFARHPVYCYAHESVAVQFFEDPSTAPFAPQLRLCPAFLFSTLPFFTHSEKPFTIHLFFPAHTAPLDGSADKAGLEPAWMTFAGLWMLGDNHQVSVDLRALPAKVRCVCVALTLSLTQREHLGMLQSACCRLLLDPRAAPLEQAGADVVEPGTELCRFAMGCQPLYRKNGVVLARLERVAARENPDGTCTPATWKFVAMGCALQGTTPIVASQELSRLAAPALNSKPRKAPPRDSTSAGAGAGTDKKEENEKEATKEEATKEGETEEEGLPSEDLLPVDENGEIDYSKVPEVKLFEVCDSEALQSAMLVPIDVTNGPSGSGAVPGAGLSSSARMPARAPAPQPSFSASVSRSMRRLIGGQSQEPPRSAPQRSVPQRQPPPPPPQRQGQGPRTSGKDSCCVM